MSYRNDYLTLDTTRRIILSPDGYVRMSLEVFMTTPIQHLISRLDNEDPSYACIESSVTDITGYTEWISCTKPAITVGWDWQLDFRQTPNLCLRVGEPRSNIMLLDVQNNDLGHEKTSSAIEEYIDSLIWQDRTLNAIGFQNL